MTKLHHPNSRYERIKAAVKKRFSFGKKSKQERSARIQKKLAQESAATQEAENAVKEWVSGSISVYNDR